jgi:hypothetical protein
VAQAVKVDGKYYPTCAAACQDLGNPVEGDSAHHKAIQRFENQPDIAVVKAETVDRLHQLMMTDLEFLKSIFSE